MGYLGAGGQTVTGDGDRLRQLYTEKDLLAAESLREGVWRRLDPPSLAAIVSTLVHEPRREEGGLTPRWPNDDVREAYDRMIRIWSDLEDAEGALALPRTGMPDGGLAWAMHRWASGQRLEDVLRGTDLLGQLTDAADPDLATTARRASDGVLRGVVAADRLD
jgi:ATP-dependent RNA helicase HelY